MIHTVVFKLDNINVPIKRILFPDSANLLNVFCDPQKFGWNDSESNDGICYMNMQGTGVTSQTILEFIRILRNKKVINVLGDDLISKMEHFAILIGAGNDDCPFRIAIDEYNAKCAEEKKKKEEIETLIQSNPMTPEKDIHHLYYWNCDTYHCSRPHLLRDEWNVTVPVHGVNNTVSNGTAVYYRKLRS